MSTLGRSLLILQVVVFAGAALMHASILLHGTRTQCRQHMTS
jgi:hypothetical protein